MSNLQNRMKKLEGSLPKQLPCFVLTSGEMCGENVISTEDEDAAVKRHLSKHPEHEGQAFNFIQRTFVHGKWNDNGDLVCDTQGCPHFSTIIQKRSQALEE